jgi:hypothetical protein
MLAVVCLLAIVSKLVGCGLASLSRGVRARGPRWHREGSPGRGGFDHCRGGAAFARHLGQGLRRGLVDEHGHYTFCSPCPALAASSPQDGEQRRSIVVAPGTDLSLRGEFRIASPRCEWVLK